MGIAMRCRRVSRVVESGNWSRLARPSNSIEHRGKSESRQWWSESWRRDVVEMLVLHGRWWEMSRDPIHYEDRIASISTSRCLGIGKQSYKHQSPIE